MEIDIHDQMMKFKECIVIMEEQLDASETKQFETHEMIERLEKKHQEMTAYMEKVRDMIDSGLSVHQNMLKRQEESMERIEKVEDKFYTHRSVSSLIGGIFGGTVVVILPEIILFIKSFF